MSAFAEALADVTLDGRSVGVTLRLVLETMLLDAVRRATREWRVLDHVSYAIGERAAQSLDEVVQLARAYLAAIGEGLGDARTLAIDVVLEQAAVAAEAEIRSHPGLNYDYSDGP